MANSFCRHLSNSYRFSKQGNNLVYQPCCWVPFSLPVKTKTQLIEAQEKISSQVLLNTKKNCGECIIREKEGYRSSGRQDALRYIPADAENGDSYTLELQIDTNCNAACTICGPNLSSLWRKQKDIIPADEDVNFLYDNLSDLIDYTKIRSIRFFGGEPLLTNSHLNILKNIPDPSLVELLYSTNGSIEPNNDVLNEWQKFKKVRLSFSIDGILDKFSYIRWPLKWKRVESNLINLTKNFKNIDTRIHCTVNPLSIWYIQDLEQWIVDLKKENVYLEYSFSPCHGVWGIDGTPTSLRQELYKRYSSNHPIIKILNAYPENTEKLYVLVNSLNNLDKERSQNWKEVFSEVAHHFAIPKSL